MVHLHCQGVSKSNASGVNLRSQKGMSLMEVALVLAVFISLISVVFLIYKNRIEPATWSSQKYTIISSIISGIENAKGSRGGVYPAYNGAITNSNELMPYLSGNSNTLPDDLLGVTYSCAPGTNQTLTLTFPYTDAENARGKAQLVQKLQRAGYVVNTSAQNLSIVIQGVSCN